jgi:transposase
MATLTVILVNPILRRFHQHLCRRNKPARVALTAVIHKLAIPLNHLSNNPSFRLTK